VTENSAIKQRGLSQAIGFGRAVSRILSAPLRAERIICLSSQYPGSVSLSRKLERAAPGSPIWPCTRWGLPCLRACAWSGGLLLHLFTLTGLVAKTGGIFSVALSVGTPRGVTSRVYPNLMIELRGIAPCGVRTFLPRSAKAEQKRFSTLPKPGKPYRETKKLTSRLQTSGGGRFQSATARSMSRV